jgi:hypothetical protein
MKVSKPSPWYRFRKWAAGHYNPDIGFGKVQMIGFERIVKLQCHMAEVEATAFVRENTAIPVPRIVKLYRNGDGIDMALEVAKGRTLDVYWQKLTPTQKEDIVKEICGYIEQLRNLVPPKEGEIGSLNMTSGLDHRLGGRRWGPFNNTTEFHTFLRRGLPLDGVWSSVPEVVKVHERPESYYATKFSHADLSPENIMVENGKVTGIIDWEFGGWYPEYWEYTKTYYGWRPYREDFYHILDRYTKTYPEELAAERGIWQRVDTFTYDMPTKEDVANGVVDETISVKSMKP